MSEGDVQVNVETEADKLRRDDADDVWLAHAERCWQAERENADRVDRRTNLISAAVFALLGLGLYRVEWFGGATDVARVQSWLVVVMIKALLIAALGCFSWALGVLHLFGPRTAHAGPRTASALLEIIEGDKHLRSRRVAFVRTYRAAEDLRRRNDRRWQKLDKAQKWFQIGVCLVILSIMLYMICSSPPVWWATATHVPVAEAMESQP
jgi:hypothetical protein